MEDLVDATRVLACLECGKCTAICPAHRARPDFSPREMVKRGMMTARDGLVCDPTLWQCVTCRLCKEVCVSDVDIPAFVRALRADAAASSNTPVQTHDGIVQAMDELMEEPALRQDRLWWLEDDMKVRVDGKGDVLLFTGCSPHYDIIFREFDGNADIPRAAVRVLNELGFEPVLLSNERCCGHDEHWTGKEDAFERLKALNREAIEATGAKVIVSPCPECAWALGELYGLEVPVLHITQFALDNMGGRELREPVPGGGPVAFHDPCRLSRYMGETEAPRALLGAMPSIEVRPMQFEGAVSRCCGVSAWINCNEGSRRLRYERLREAEEAGASTLVTACPKCRIHFNCYLSSDKVDPVGVGVEDITVLLAKAMGVWR